MMTLLRLVAADSARYGMERRICCKLRWTLLKPRPLGIGFILHGQRAGHRSKQGIVSRQRNGRGIPGRRKTAGHRPGRPHPSTAGTSDESSVTLLSPAERIAVGKRSSVVHRALGHRPAPRSEYVGM